MALKNNTWKLNQWYDQSVAGNISYTGAKQLWAWGYNNKGQLGQNSKTAYSSPVQIPGVFSKGSDIGDVSVGDYMVGTIKSDNTLWVWGENGNGQLGQNNRTDYSSPVQVGSSADWEFVEMGMNYMAAIKTDGTLWMWGNQGANPNGVLGQNQGTTEYSSPVQIHGGGTNWRNIECSIVNVFATKTDGTMWVWGGQNDAGNLGLNEGGGWSAHMKSSPTQLPGTTWSRASTNNYSVAATKTDGTLWAWGINNYGGLGQNVNGAPGSRSSPVQVGSGTDWAIVQHDNNAGVIALKTDGTLWSWGYNQQGNLGHNNRTNYSSPKQIPGTTWSKVAGNIGGFFAMKTDGTMWGWGQNTYGGLGQNNETYYSSPVQVGSDTDWVSIFGGPNGNRGIVGIKDV